jgi:hypothetical protein
LHLHPSEWFPPLIAPNYFLKTPLHCNFRNNYGHGSRHMNTHSFQEQKLREQRKMVCNKISWHRLPPLKNNNEMIARKLTCQRGMTTAQTQKLQTVTTSPIACKVEEQQTSDNHEEVQLQLQDLNFAKLNQTRTRIMEQNSEQASTTEPLMSAENNLAQFHCKQHHQKMERNCIATTLYNKHLRLSNLLGKHLRLAELSKGIVLCIHLRKKTVWQASSPEAHKNKEKITHSNMPKNVF